MTPTTPQPDLLGFARAVINDHWLEHGVIDPEIDGGTLQELGERYGLLIPRTVAERCGDECGCADNGFPATCYRVHETLKGTSNDPE